MKKHMFFLLAAMVLIPMISICQVNPSSKPGDTLNKTDATGAKSGYWEEKIGEVLNKGFYSQNKKVGAGSVFTQVMSWQGWNLTRTGKKDGPSIQLDRRGKNHNV